MSEQERKINEYTLGVVKQLEEYANLNGLDFDLLKNKLIEVLSNQNVIEEEPLFSSITVEVPLTDYLFLKTFVACLKDEFHFDVIDEDLVEEFLNRIYQQDLDNPLFQRFTKDKNGRLSLKNSWWNELDGRLNSAREIYPVKRIRKISLSESKAYSICCNESVYGFLDKIRPFVNEYVEFLKTLSKEESLLYHNQINVLSFIILFIEKLKKENVSGFDYSVLANMLFAIRENPKYQFLSENLFISEEELGETLGLLESSKIIKIGESNWYDIVASYDVDLEGVSKNYPKASKEMEEFVQDYLKSLKTTTIAKNRKKVLYDVFKTKKVTGE